MFSGHFICRTFISNSEHMSFTASELFCPTAKTLPIAGFSTVKNTVYYPEVGGKLLMADDLSTSIGNKIKERRKFIGLSRESLAAKTIPAMSSKYLWEVENGRKNLSADMLRRLSIALSVSSDWLLGLSSVVEANEN